MTCRRRLAMWLSSWGTLWATAGSKEWAQGLEREARVIESDWAALRWSLGSTRVLLDRRPASLTSLDEVPAATQKLVEGARSWACVFLFTSIMQGLINLLPFFLARIVRRPAGCALVVLASIITGAYSLIERRRLKEPWKDNIYEDLVACTSFYKEQLKRLDSVWIYFSLWFCMTLNYYMHDKDMFDLWLFAGMFLFTLSVTQQKKRNNLRRIEEIDALLAERE